MAKALLVGVLGISQSDSGPEDVMLISYLVLLAAVLVAIWFCIWRMYRTIASFTFVQYFVLAGTTIAVMIAGTIALDRLYSGGAAQSGANVLPLCAAATAMIIVIRIGAVELNRRRNRDPGA
jgi:FlaA1/EpsC-like NDP-sugar epimerase